MSLKQLAENTRKKFPKTEDTEQEEHHGGEGKSNQDLETLLQN